MNRWLLISMAAGTASVGAVKMLADPPVNLQAVTPGVAQTGQLNITGTARAGFFKGDGGQIVGLNAAALDFGNITLTGTSATYIIRGSNDSGAANATGVIGLETSLTGVTYGGWFESKSESGRALFGYASAPTGATYGVYGVAQGNGGRAVFGLANHASGNTYGGWFQSNSPDGVGGYARNTAGGVGLRAESSGLALEVMGKAQFNGFTGVGPRALSIGANDVFGISSNLTDWTGMYVTTGAGGKPYYGYDNGPFRAYTYLDGIGTFHIVNGSEKFDIERYGNVLLTTTAAGTASALSVANFGTGETLTAKIANGASTASVASLTANGDGNGISILLSKSTGVGRGINIIHSGEGLGSSRRLRGAMLCGASRNP